MPVVDRELAIILEAAEALHLREQVRAYAHDQPQAEATTLEVAGGIAALTSPQFGRKLNHVTAVAMEQELDSAALTDLEALYAARAIPLEIDLCPYAIPSALIALGAHGYCVNAFANTYWLPLADDAAPDAAAAVHVRRVLAHEATAFIEASIAGFSAQPNPRPRELLLALARSAAARQDTQLFAAELNGKLAGTAALALLETKAGPVGHLFLASTLPQLRNRGVQAALLSARTAAARELGATLASITARPATISARNAERAGYRLAYTKPTLVRVSGSRARKP